MNDPKLKKLFATARTEAAVPPPEDFATRTAMAVRREAVADTSASAETDASWFDALGSLLPRLSVAAALVLGVGFAAEFYFSAGDGGLTGEASHLAQQWLFTMR